MNKAFNIHTVFAITKKELKSFFDHPTAYILLLIITGVSYYFFFQIVAISREASVRAYFEMLPWFFLFFIPAVTMRSFSEEYRRGTIETLLTGPLTNLEAVIGKFLGSFIFSISPLVISLVLPLSFARYGRLDFGVVFGQYIGAVLLAAAFTALGLWMSSLTKNQIIALMGTIVSGFFLMLIHSEFITMSLPYGVGEIFRHLSITTHATSVSRGVIDFRDIAYFLGFITTFLMLTLVALNGRLGFGRDLRFNYITAGALAVVVGLNAIALQVPWRLDLTSEKVYTLSQATVNIINKAKGPYDITVYASEQLPPQIQMVARDVWDILNDYQRLSKGKIKIKKVDPGKDEKAAQEAMANGVQPVQFNSMSRGELKVNQGYFGLVTAKGKEHESIPFIQNSGDIEYQMSSTIAKLSKSKTPVIGLLQGHGEDGLSGDYQLFGGELSKVAQIASLSITDTTTAISKNCDMILAIGPKSEINSHDIEIIDAFVKDGGTAVFAHDGVIVQTQNMTADKNQATFNKLYEKWGVKLNSDLAYDIKANAQVTAGGGGINYIVPYPYWIKSISDPAKPLTKKIETILLPWASSISTFGKEKDKLTTVLKTSDAGGVKMDNFNIGSVQNAFDDKNVSSRTLAVLAKVGKGQALVIGDSDFLKNQFLQQSQQNLLFMLNTVDVFTQAQGLSEIRSKGATSSTLNFQSPQDYEVLRYGNIVLSCIAIIAFGAYRLLRRLRRQSLTFS